jgi:hypothetical protein
MNETNQLVRIASRLLARELTPHEVREVSGGYFEESSSGNGNTNPTYSGTPCCEDDCGRDN